MPSSNDFDSTERWSDRDPALKQALEALKTAPSKAQAQIALNVMMVIIEHGIESDTLSDVDHLIDRLTTCRDKAKQQANRRWYDVNSTLKSALQLLQDCPDDIQRHVIPMISTMVDEALQTEPSSTR